jgi:signal transduction histidine kinase/DNA-binding NarL/FixJ family response regulator
MRTLLVLTKQPSLAAAVETALDPGKFQIIVKEGAHEAEFLLARGAIDATILDAELTDARAIRLIEELKTYAPGGPIVVYAGAKQWEWEEDAYLIGVAHVLAKPVRAKLLSTLLERLFPDHEVKGSSASLPPQPLAEAPANRSGFAGETRRLEALRRFAGVLAHSLDSRALLQSFLLLLREIIGVNRAIIFLRKPSAILSDSPLAVDDRWLRSACAIGLDQSVLQHFALSLGAGIGGYLHRQGRILRPTHPDALASREITKEFQLLGAQVAIPILDRQSLLGVAVLDERLTGEPYNNEELAVLFHMLEEIGLAIRNSWLHDQLSANHDMIADILSHLGNACVVVGQNLSMLHANAAAARLFLHDRPGKSRLEFSDLPQELGSMVFTVLKSGVGLQPFKQHFVHLPGTTHRVSIVPFRTQAVVESNSALLLVEDITEHERAAQLETEASNLRLIKSMAEHLAHEIGNALVPISTHQQLLKESINDPEFQESLSGAMAGGVKRIARLANQMVFLARDWQGEYGAPVMLSDLIVEAFHEAHTYQPGKKVAQLAFNKSVAPWKISGDHKALRHAFSEIILNALQANPEDPNVAVVIEEAKRGESPTLKVEVRDSGKGFTPETAERAQEPFFSTRNVGLGIGLTVSRKIIESHRGRIEIPASAEGGSGVVRISLPLSD